MASTANIKAVITAEDNASKTLANVGNSFSKLLKITAVGAVAAGAAAVAFGVSAVKSFEESENAAAQLNAVLKSTGGAAGVSADMVNGLAESLQKTTKYSDESIVSAQNMLLTFTKIGKDVFPDTTKAVLDMSTAMGTDLQSTAIQVGKALQDPVRGVTALQRVGVRLSDSQKELVEQMVAVGDVAGAQKLILKELQVEFGGSAEAAGNTFAGKLEILKNQFDDVKESIGKTLVEALQPLMKQLSDFVASDKFQAWLKELNVWLTTNIPKAIAWLKDVGIPAMKQAFELLWPVVKLVVEWFIKLINFLSDHTWVFWSLVTALTALKVALFLQGALQAFQAVMTGVKVAAATTRAFVLAPWALPAIGIAAVIAAFVVVTNKWKETHNTINNTKNAIADMGASNAMVIGRLNALLQGTAAEAARAQKALQGLGVSQKDINAQLGLKGGYASGGFTGRGAENEVAGVVHRGEYVIPKTAVDQSTGMPKVQVGQSGESISINVNVGLYAGTEMEKRRVAEALFEALKDAAGSKNMSIGKMFGI